MNLLLKREKETIVLKVEDEEENQFLVGISNPVKSVYILDAYQISDCSGNCFGR